MLFSLFLNMMKTEHWGRLKDTQTPCAPLTLTPSHLWQSSSLKWWASTSMTSTFTLVLMRYGNIVHHHYIRYFQYSLMLSCMCRKGHLMHRKVFTSVRTNLWFTNYSFMNRMCHSLAFTMMKLSNNMKVLFYVTYVDR